MNDRLDERRMLADSVADFARGEDAIARVRRLREEQQSFSRDAWNRLADMGWLGILVPEESGGLGLGVPEMAIVAEGLGGARLPEPVTAVAGFAAPTIAGGDNRALCLSLLDALMNGRKLIAVAWQEDPADAALDEVASEAEESAGGWLLTGRKYLAVPAEADDFIVNASTANGVALFRVPADAPGLRTQVQEQVDGSRVAELQLGRVPVGEQDVIASPKAGLAALQRGIAHARVLASAEMLGLSDSLLKLTIDYLGSRKQFDRPLSAFQVLRHRVVNLYIQTELMRAALRHAVGVLEQDTDLVAISKAASRAKARAGDAAMTIARDAVQLHGAIGYTEEANVGIYMHRILALSAWLGNAAWHRRRYAELIRPGLEETA